MPSRSGKPARQQNADRLADHQPDRRRRSRPQRVARSMRCPSSVTPALASAKTGMMPKATQGCSLSIRLSAGDRASRLRRDPRERSVCASSWVERSWRDLRRELIELAMDAALEAFLAPARRAPGSAGRRSRRRWSDGCRRRRRRPRARRRAPRRPACARTPRPLHQEDASHARRRDEQARAALTPAE